MPYVYPVDAGLRDQAIDEVENQKRRIGFERAMTDAMWPRILKLTGWPVEVWEDRRLVIEDAIRTHFNPRLCDAVVDPDPRRFHAIEGIAMEDANSPVTDKGHDGIRVALKHVIKSVYPELDKAVASDLLRGSEWLFFFFMRNTFPAHSRASRR